MFHKSKLMFWTSEVLLLTIIFFIWRQMGDMITPRCEYHLDSLSCGRISLLYYESAGEISPGKAQNQPNDWDSDYAQPFVWLDCFGCYLPLADFD